MTIIDIAAAHDHVTTWIAAERAQYAENKWAVSGSAAGQLPEGRLTQEALDFVLNYLGRARTLGTETPLGRQALAKAAVTLLDYVEKAVLHQGPLPEPGHPSGTNVKWNTP